MTDKPIHVWSVKLVRLKDGMPWRTVWKQEVLVPSPVSNEDTALRLALETRIFNGLDASCPSEQFKYIVRKEDW